MWQCVYENYCGFRWFWWTWRSKAFHTHNKCARLFWTRRYDAYIENSNLQISLCRSFVYRVSSIVTHIYVYDTYKIPITHPSPTHFLIQCGHRLICQILFIYFSPYQNKISETFNRINRCICKSESFCTCNAQNILKLKCFLWNSNR